MARIRSIKPELRVSLTVAEWPREVRYTWVLLWGYLDDYGRGVDDIRLLAADLFPLDRDVTERKLNGWLSRMTVQPADLDKPPPLCRYQLAGRSYLHAVNWKEHQKPQHPTPSRIPPCPHHETSGAIPEPPPKPSRAAHEGFGTGCAADRSQNGNDVLLNGAEPAESWSRNGNDAVIHSPGDGHSTRRYRSVTKPAASSASTSTPKPAGRSPSRSREPHEPLSASRSARSREQGAGSREQGEVPTAAGAPRPARTLTQRSKVITDIYAAAEPMCRWPAVNGIVIKALKTDRWTETEIRDALLRLASEHRTVTVDTLRVELDGIPPAKATPGPARGNPYLDDLRGAINAADVIPIRPALEAQ